MPYPVSDLHSTLGLKTEDHQALLARLPAETLLGMLEKMYLTRYFEEKAEDLYAGGLVHGTMHLSIGMEASPVGSIAAIEPEDYIIHHHRGHGHTIAKGADILLMMAEFLGKEAGYCRGRGGSMHIADIEGHNLGATGIVGSGMPTGVGIALALQMQRSTQILLCFFGDGAANIGEFHESINLASVWKLPVVFVCDNNQYGMSMAAEKAMNVAFVADRACAYGIPGVTVDGNDVLAVYAAVEAAAARARAGLGPSLVENLTYRWRGHSKSDRNLYRSSAEIAEWQANDPIQRFASLLLSQAVLSETEQLALDQRCKQQIEEAAQRALQLPDPDPARLEEEVYAP